MKSNSTTPSKTARRVRRAAALVALLFASYLYVDLYALKTDRVQRGLTTRLERAFGRPVEVSNFELRLLDGPRLVANYVTVAEDPRFGYEPFLRTERVSAAVDLGALVRGRIEFNSLRFTRPSFNLVRNPDGGWNFTQWLGGAAAAAGAPALPLTAEHPRLSRISVQSGRINFKRGVDKLPFALTGVNGSLERDGDRWRLDFELVPMRSGATVQEPGTLRIRGRIGATRGGMHPSELQLTWADASLADLFRLIYVRDVGVRGGLNLDVTLRTEPQDEDASAWRVQGKVSFENVHSAEIPTRTNQPSVNLLLDAVVYPRTESATLHALKLQMPASEVRVSGKAGWRGGPALELFVASSGISLVDLFAWLRAFRPGVSESATLAGNLGMTAQISGWPPRVTQGVLATDGGELRLPGAPQKVRMGPSTIRWHGNALEWMPTVLRLAPAGGPELSPAAAQKNEIRLRGRGEAVRGLPFSLHLALATGAAEDILPFAAALAWPVARGWMMEGGVTADVTWSGQLVPFRATPRGKVEFRDVRLLDGFLNQPILLREARVTMNTSSRGNGGSSTETTVEVKKAEAFGANWRGTARRAGGAPWSFALAADRLDAADLDRWLNPRGRQSTIARTAERVRRAMGGAPADVRRIGFDAEGRIAVQELRLAPLTLRKVHGTLALEGSRIVLRGAQAELARGMARGEFAVRFSAPAEYTFKGAVERVNLAELAAASAAWRGRAAGVVAGTLELTARGDTRAALAQSLVLSGELTVREGDVRAVDFDAWAAGEPRAGRSAFREARGKFRLADGVVTLNPLEVRGAKQAWCISGTVRVPDTMDLALLPRAEDAASCIAVSEQTSGDAASRRLRGTLEQLSAPAPAKAP